MKIAVGNIRLGQTQGRIINMTRPITEKYCKINGYDYIIEEDRIEGVLFLERGKETDSISQLLAPHCHKIAFVLKHLQKYDWFVYLDCDAPAIDPTIPMEKFINEANSNHFLLMANEPLSLAEKLAPGIWRPNNCMLIIRNCLEAIDFFQRWGKKCVLTKAGTCSPAWWEMTGYADHQEESQHEANHWYNHIKVYRPNIMWSEVDDYRRSSILKGAVPVVHTCGGRDRSKIIRFRKLLGV